MKGKWGYQRNLESELLTVYHGISYSDIFNEKEHFTVENYKLTYQSES